jgi:hypothetical protein
MCNDNDLIVTELSVRAADLSLPSIRTMLLVLEESTIFSAYELGIYRKRLL